MEKITTVGIDLAKNVFSVHGVDQVGRVVLKKTVSRAKLADTVAQWPSCTIGMEACTGSHQWARQFERFGHTVRLMAPKFVAPEIMAILVLDQAFLCVPFFPLCALKVKHLGLKLLRQRS